MYIHGGKLKGSPTALNDMWKFNLFSESWSQVFSFDDFPAMSGHKIYYYNDRIFFIGSTDIYEYNLDTDTVIKWESTLSGRTGAEVTCYENYVYIFYKGSEESDKSSRVEDEAAARMKLLPE